MQCGMYIAGEAGQRGPPAAVRRCGALYGGACRAVVRGRVTKLTNKQRDARRHGPVLRGAAVQGKELQQWVQSPRP